jgi:hypothetical protein
MGNRVEQVPKYRRILKVLSSLAGDQIWRIPLVDDASVTTSQNRKKKPVYNDQTIDKFWHQHINSIKTAPFSPMHNVPQIH